MAVVWYIEVRMIRFIVLLIMLFVPVDSHSMTDKWIDNNGVSHFSGTPPTIENTAQSGDDRIAGKNVAKHSDVAFLPNFTTPKDTMETMLQARKNMDAHLFSECLSITDRRIYDSTVGTIERVKIKKRKESTENEVGKRLGDDLYEYKMLDSWRHITDKEFELYHITQEMVWHDIYAEVTLIMPAHGDWFLPIATVYFVKEGSKWKICQWMMINLMMGWIAENKSINDAVNFQLASHTDLKLNRRDCSFLKKREFPISAKLSEVYNKAWQNATGKEKSELLIWWLFTGDKKASEIWNVERENGELKDYNRIVSLVLKMIDSSYPCNATDKAQVTTNIDTPEYWFKSAGSDVMALRNLIRKFPKERSWCVKAQMKIAKAFFYTASPDIAIAEYQKIINDYPEFQNEAVEAKTDMATLFWVKLDQHDKAILLWRELKAIGKLPKDAVLSNHTTSTPSGRVNGN